MPLDDLDAILGNLTKTNNNPYKSVVPQATPAIPDVSANREIQPIKTGVEALPKPLTKEQAIIGDVVPQFAQPAALDFIKTGSLEERISTGFERAIETKDRGKQKIQEGSDLIELGKTEGGATSIRGMIKKGAGVAEVLLSGASGMIGFFEPDVRKAIEEGELERLAEQKGIAPIVSMFKTIKDNPEVQEFIKSEAGQDVLDVGEDLLTISAVTGGLAEVKEATKGFKEIKQVGQEVKTLGSEIKEGATTAVGEIKAGVNKVFESRHANNVAKLNKAKAELEALSKSPNFIETSEIQRIAGDAGITNLPLSATSSDLVGRVEGLLGEGLFGAAYKKEAKEAINIFNEFAESIAGRGQLKESLGSDVSKIFAEAKKAEDDLVKSLYKQASEIAEASGKPIAFETTKTTNLLDDLIKREKDVVGIQDTALIGKLESLKTGLSGERAVQGTTARINLEGLIETGIPAKGKEFGLVTVDQAEATRKKIGDLANFDNFSPTTSEKNFRNVYNTLKEEIGTSISKEVPEFKASLDEAKSKFKQVKELENRAFFKSIKSFAEKKQFDKIINTFASPSASTADIRDAYGFLGEAAELKIQKSMMSDIIHKAKGASGEFTASGFSKQFKSLGDEKLRALFSKEQLRQLKDLNTLNVALSKSQKVAGGSQTALIQGFSNFFRAGAAISSSGVSLLSEYGISKFFRTQKGKDLLTKFGNKELSEIKALIKRIDKLEGKVN